MPRQPLRYDRFSVCLHWLMALLILAQLALGLWMTGLPKDGSGLRAYWFNMHKSLGMALGLLALLRLAWALRRPRVAPSQPQRQPHALQLAAKGAHGLLYACMVAVPLSGFLGSVFSGYPIRFFGLQLPRLAGRWEGGKELFSSLHQGAAVALEVLVALHVLAFLYHQCVLKDGLLQRMGWASARPQEPT